MSMNIYIEGTRKVLLKSNPSKESTQTIHFNCWQTPTDVTDKILKSKDQMQAYKDWVMDFYKRVKIEDDCGDVYDGYSEDHIERLNEFIKKCKNESYEIEIYQM